MFESSLVVRRRSHHWGLKLGLAVLIHVGVATAVVLASAWSVRPVEPPDLVVQFQPLPVTPPLGDETPKPATPPPPRPAAHPPSTPPVPQQPQPPRALDVQPKDVPSSLPVPPSAPPVDDSASDLPPGPPSGPGVPWGDPNATGPSDAPSEITIGMTKPETIARVTPQYTELGRRGHVQGVVILRATIDRTGHVVDVQVLKPLGYGLDESAMAAVRQWQFRPATLNGRPVPVFFQLSVKFSIQ